MVYDCAELIDEVIDEYESSQKKGVCQTNGLLFVSRFIPHTCNIST